MPEWSYKHGHARRDVFSGTRSSYKAMIQRCTNPNHESYEAYKRIPVCARWRKPDGVGFANFLEDMGERPEGHTLERIKNHLGYTPSNCRWATPKEQGRNRSTNINLRFRGKTQSATDWAIELGLNPITVIGRLRRGWTVKRTLTTPPQKRSK